MTQSQPFEIKPTSWHIGVAAEAFTAAQFARLGYNVSVQYGADQPEYDLIVGTKDHLMKVSVKGSQDGGWGITLGYLTKATKESGKKADYQGAIKLWLKAHGLRTVLCLVQFGETRIDELPRMYLATPTEIAQALKTAKNGRGEAMLNEDWKLTRGPYAGTTEKLPDEWRFTSERIKTLLIDPNVGMKVEKL